MKILVTGAYGQLGSTIRELSVEYPQWEFLFTDVDSLDITDEHAVEKYFQANLPGFVINCAAYTAVDQAETDIENAKAINVTAPGILAKAAEKLRAGFMHISTDYVFDGKSCVPYSEKVEPNPTGIYGATKLDGERRSLDFNSETIIIRTSWLYSLYGNNFVKTMLRLGQERKELNVVFDQIGTPTFAEDLAQAILEIIGQCETNPEASFGGIYHYANEGVASWYDFARAIFELSGTNCKVHPVLSAEFPSPAQRPHYSVLNKSKIKTTFNLEIPYWKESLEKFLKKL